MMSKLLSSALLILLTSLSAGAQSPDQDGVLKFGREVGWKDFPTLMGTGFQKAKDGTLDLTLAAAEYQADEDTDLLVHFNDRLVDEASRYSLPSKASVIQRGFSALGGGCAVFRGNTPLVLQATSEALFSGGKGWGDFSLEFWLYPSVCADGETVLEWTGGRTSSGTFETQDFRVGFENSHVVWTLQNLFAPSPEAPAVTIALKADNILVPKQWHHHLLRYRAATGLLEYLVDGQTEALVHATPSGTEDGKPYAFVTGPRTRGEVVLGSRYQGALDELRLSRSWVENPQRDRYVSDFATKGTAISRIFDLRFPGSTLESLAVRASSEGDSALVWSFRMADTIRYQWTFGGDTARSLAAPEAEEDSWIRFRPGQDLSRMTSGRYLQIRVDFLPSGTGTETPRVNQITAVTRPNPPPPVPEKIQVIPGDGQVTIRWRPVLQGAPDGYLVFFGPRPGQTRGTVCAQGTSPLDVGKATEIVLTGLADDQIYYFNVAAYRGAAVGPVSRDYTARPQRKAP